MIVDRSVRFQPRPGGPMNSARVQLAFVGDIDVDHVNLGETGILKLPRGKSERKC